MLNDATHGVMQRW